MAITLQQIMTEVGIAQTGENMAIVRSLFEESSQFKTKYSLMSGFLIESFQYSQVCDYLKENFESHKQKLKDRAVIEEYGSLDAKKEHDESIAQIMVTSGYGFEGYRITKYSGYISGDASIQINRGGVTGDILENGLSSIRRKALSELKEAANALGCNAVIGVDYDYLTLEQETISGPTHYYEPYIICVTANGTAVTIEKE